MTLMHVAYKKISVLYLSCVCNDKTEIFSRQFKNQFVWKISISKIVKLLQYLVICFNELEAFIDAM